MFEMVMNLSKSFVRDDVHQFHSNHLEDSLPFDVNSDYLAVFLNSTKSFQNLDQLENQRKIMKANVESIRTNLLVDQIVDDNTTYSRFSYHVH